MDPNESRLLLSSIKALRTQKDLDLMLFSELKVDAQGLGKTGVFFLLDGNTRRNVTEHGVAVRSICFKLRNLLGFLHSSVKMKRNNLRRPYEKLAHKQLLLVM